MGWLLAAMVHPADLQDRDGARLLLARLVGRFPRLRRLWARWGYQGPKPRTWLRRRTDWVLDIVSRFSTASGFQVLPRHWVVERTRTWLGRHRRLGKDYKGLPETSKTWIQIAIRDRMRHRLSPA